MRTCLHFKSKFYCSQKLSRKQHSIQIYIGFMIYLTQNIFIIIYPSIALDTDQ